MKDRPAQQTKAGQPFSGSEAMGTTPELETVPMDTLLNEILRRKDELLTAEGWLPQKSFALADTLGIRVCVDGVPARVNEAGDVELMAIRRNTGPYAGKLALIGGGVGRVEENGEWAPESIEEALRRHFEVDLGFDIEPVGSWQSPAYIAQDMRPIDGEVRPGFTPNPNSRHLVAIRYLVQLNSGRDAPVFGITELGGQEASGVEWLSEKTMPDPTEFGYGHHETYRVMFPIARQLLSS